MAVEETHHHIRDALSAFNMRYIIYLAFYWQEASKLLVGIRNGHTQQAVFCYTHVVAQQKAKNQFGDFGNTEAKVLTFCLTHILNNQKKVSTSKFYAADYTYLITPRRFRKNHYKFKSLPGIVCLKKQNKKQTWAGFLGNSVS